MFIGTEYRSRWCVCPAPLLAGCAEIALQDRTVQQGCRVISGLGKERSGGSLPASTEPLSSHLVVHFTYFTVTYDESSIMMDE